MLLGAVVFFVGLMVSIALHEAGHMLVAKRAGARVSAFMVGFGPSLVSFRRGATRYGLKLLPFGGYVRILGMRAPDPGASPPAESDEERQVPGRDFYQLSAPRRIATLLAGPLANLLFAAVLLIVVLSVLGIPSTSNRVGEVRACSAEKCAPGQAASPAQAAGFLPGDEIVAVDMRAVSTWEEVAAAIAAAPINVGMTVEIRRDGKSLTLRPVAVENPTRPGSGYLGLSPAIVLARQSPVRVPELLWMQSTQVAKAVSTFPVRIFQTFDQSMRGESRPVDGPVGIVGVGRIGVDIGSTDVLFAQRLGQLLVLLAGLNVSLAVFNLIPLLPLDGGHVALTLFESTRSRLARLRRRPDPGPVHSRHLALVTQLVIVFFVTSSVLLLFVDLVNPVRLP
jgi:membrane-associated protease RseP (regulator of RpoE activity)